MTTAVLERRPTEAAAPPAAISWAPLIVVLAGTFMTFLDFFIVNVALPSIQTDLHAGRAAVQLVVAGYGLFFAIGMISGGRLGDLYGRRRMFAIGLALFTVTSAACGLAPNSATLVTARVLQGAAGALLTPQVLAILGTVYVGAQRAKAFAAYGLAMGVAAVLGQLIGGALVQADILGSGWRGVFLINMPVGIAALLVVRTVPESSGHRARLDLTGTALVTAGLVAVVLPLTEGQQYGWPEWTWLSLAASPVLLAGFVLHQLRRQSGTRPPLVDLALFEDRAFSLGSLAALTFSLIPASFFFVLALYLQQARGFTPLFSGVIFSAAGAGFFAALLTAERTAARLGHQILALGAVVVGVGCLLLAAVAASPATSLELVPGLAVIGFGLGMVLVPLSATVLADVAPEHAGAGAGVLSTAQQVGAALGVAVIGVVYYRALGSGGFAHAFIRVLYVQAGLTLVTAALVQLLPRHARH